MPPSTPPQPPPRIADALRSRIAMHLHGSAGDPALRALLLEAGTALGALQAEIDYWRGTAQEAWSLRDCEVDDGK